MPTKEEVRKSLVGSNDPQDPNEPAQIDTLLFELSRARAVVDGLYALLQTARMDALLSLEEGVHILTHYFGENQRVLGELQGELKKAAALLQEYSSEAFGNKLKGG